MNPRLLTSAVAIHAAACVVAFFAVGPRQTDASYDFLKLDSHPNPYPYPYQNPSGQPISHPNLPSAVPENRAHVQHVQKIAIAEWSEAEFNSQLEATSEIETELDSSATDGSLAAEVVVATPPPIVQVLSVSPKKAL